LIFSELLTFLH